MNILALGKRRLQLRNTGDMGKKPQFDLRIVRRDELMASRAIKARRIFRPASLRTGIFCKFGSDEESLPVVVAASA